MDSNHVTQPPRKIRDLRLAASLGAAESSALGAQSADICPDLLSWLDASPVPLSDSVRRRIVEIVHEAGLPGKGVNGRPDDPAPAKDTTIFSDETRNDVLQQVAHALFPETAPAEDVPVDEGRGSNRIVALGGRLSGDTGREVAELIVDDSQTEEARS